MKRVTGLGGVFFKSKDNAALKQWYRDHLGIESEDWGTMFQWRDNDAPDEKGYTVWGPFKDDTEYFAPSDKPYMINYRVADMDALVAALAEEGVQLVGEVEQHENGKFAWVIDPEGNKCELWEPIASKHDPYL